MTDEVYEFIQDCKEKAHTARSARNTRTHCGKGGRVKFPSDNLTKKEREAMNGECKSYRLNDPMSYAEFKELPDDLKEVYLNSIIKRYDAPLNAISKAMGMDGSTLSWLIKRLELKVAHDTNRGRSGWDKDGFYAWWNGIKKETDNPTVDEPCEAVEAPVAEVNDIDEWNDVDPDKNYYHTEITMQATTYKEQEPIKESNEQATDDNSSTENPPIICDNPYHSMPVIPARGNMSFYDNDVEDILQTLKCILSGTRVNMTVTWDCK